ncbi:MAG: hypothetical protein HY208_06360 [Nitrospirae bacterium]|nr:hypothetical protein [Nitrospirota bacterium]
MTRRIVTGMLFLLLALSLPGLGLAATFNGTLMKVEGSVYVVKDDRSGTERRILIDQSTIKVGELKEGAMVEVEVDDTSGFAKVIKAKKT